MLQVVEYKTPGEIDAMHAAGQVVARILAAVRDQAGDVGDGDSAAP